MICREEIRCSFWLGEKMKDQVKYQVQYRVFDGSIADSSNMLSVSHAVMQQLIHRM